MEETTEGKVTNVGWPAFTLLIIFSAVAFTVNIYAGFIELFIGYIGAIIGNFIRNYGAPSSYFTDGTALGGFKARFYWAYGPQINGLLAINFIVYIGMIVFGGSAGSPNPT